MPRNGFFAPNLTDRTENEMPSPVYDAKGEAGFERWTSQKFRTFGLSQVYFDRLRMKRAAAHRLAYRLIKKVWLGRRRSPP